MNVTEMILILAVVVILLAYRFKIRKTAPNKVARLSRITNASFVFRLLIYLGLIFQVYVVLAYYFGWPGHDRFKIVIASNHSYPSPAEMPPPVQALWLVQMGLGFWAMVLLSRLFQLYEQGIFFTAKNVNYIRFFGWFLIINWVVDYQLQGFLHDMQLSTTALVGGFLIIFIAWIMDEGRKIQEEHELTV